MPLLRDGSSSVCGAPRTFWLEAEEAARVSLRARIALWDDIHTIRQQSRQGV